ncbi:hypothetical protein XBFM1_1660014 [Xenorhabdus bovienii str. feltiae Moldova]|uniref:Uncharacterized protein n=1 Tax=Xenorhabdus bovienii str. feltiae Moldova TaxID=1398200 RepID=A0A077NPH6_XENBV|nr:hypothetical protein XBFM1_1660014 [Xenorhabdus bovienii str. feltiae Moldova]
MVRLLQFSQARINTRAQTAGGVKPVASDTIIDVIWLTMIMDITHSQHPVILHGDHWRFVVNLKVFIYHIHAPQPHFPQTKLCQVLSWLGVVKKVV